MSVRLVDLPKRHKTEAEVGRLDFDARMRETQRMMRDIGMSESREVSRNNFP
jgi:hypothetical protein